MTDEDAMAKTAFKSVDEYIARQPNNVQPILQRVRHAIRQALPGAEEVISYGIPTYRLHGTHVVYFAGWKDHYSVYPVTRRLVEAFQDDLTPYAVEKGTVRFSLSDPVPAKLIGRMAKFLANDASERARSKSARSRSRK